jgi:ribulose-phosphate 3-epimerase
MIRRIHERGRRAAVSIKPATPLNRIEGLLEDLDMVMVMTVNPGFSFQKMIPECVEKVADLRKRVGSEFDIEVDGGINTETIADVARAGANVIVAGGAVYAADDVARAVRDLKSRLQEEFSPEG